VAQFKIMATPPLFGGDVMSETVCGSADDGSASDGSAYDGANSGEDLVYDGSSDSGDYDSGYEEPVGNLSDDPGTADSATGDSATGDSVTGDSVTGDSGARDLASGSVYPRAVTSDGYLPSDTSAAENPLPTGGYDYGSLPVSGDTAAVMQQINTQLGIAYGLADLDGAATPAVSGSVQSTLDMIHNLRQASPETLNWLGGLAAGESAYGEVSNDVNRYEQGYRD